MFFQRVKTEGLGHNAYVLDCGEGQAVVIDPRRDVAEYVRLARENDLSIAYVLETHRQEDFEFGSRTLAGMTGARIVSGTHPLFGIRMSSWRIAKSWPSDAAASLRWKPLAIPRKA